MTNENNIHVLVFFFNYVKSEAILIKDKKKGTHPDMYYFKIAIHLD